MPFREKLAWISFVTWLVVGTAYFGAMATDILPAPSLSALHWGILSVLAVLLLQLVLRRVAARGPDAATPKDERERLIELKATRVAFYVLIAAALVVVFLAYHTRILPMRYLGLAVVAAVIAGDLVKSAAQIVYFRRDA